MHKISYKLNNVISSKEIYGSNTLPTKESPSIGEYSIKILKEKNCTKLDYILWKNPEKFYINILI